MRASFLNNGIHPSSACKVVPHFNPLTLHRAASKLVGWAQSTLERVCFNSAASASTASHHCRPLCLVADSPAALIPTLSTNTHPPLVPSYQTGLDTIDYEPTLSTECQQVIINRFPVYRNIQEKATTINKHTPRGIPLKRGGTLATVMADVRRLHPQKRPRLAASFLSLSLMKTILLTGVTTATPASHNQETTPPVPVIDNVLNKFESVTLDSTETPASRSLTTQHTRYRYARCSTTQYPGEIIIKEWDESILDAQLACEINTKTGEISFFTDGAFASGEPGSGAAVVWRLPGELQDWWDRECRTLWGINDNNEAEAFAVWLALRVALWMQSENMKITHINIFTDSRTVLKRVDWHSADDRLVAHTDPLIRYTQNIHNNTRVLMAVGVKVTLRWVKAHKEKEDPKWAVMGNMMADRLAKEARPLVSNTTWTGF